MFNLSDFNFQKLLLLTAVGYVLILGLLFFFQRKLQYIPMGKVGPVSFYNLDDFAEEKITTEDGIKILSWYKPAKKNEKIILYFHGNAGNLGDRAHKFDSFAKNGFGVLAITYRGYSGSEGKPSEEGLMNDGRAAFKFLLDKGYSPQDIIVFGESLGSAVAVQLASKFDFYALILESPLASIADIAQKTYWFVPVNLLLKDKFESIKFAPKISSPTLIFHGTNDLVVAYSEGQKLFETIKSPKKFITVEGGGHLNFGDEFLLEEIKFFLSKNKKS